MSNFKSKFIQHVRDHSTWSLTFTSLLLTSPRLTMVISLLSMMKSSLHTPSLFKTFIRHWISRWRWWCQRFWCHSWVVGDVIVDTVVVGDVDGDDIIDFESNDFVISVFGDNFAGEDVTKCWHQFVNVRLSPLGGTFQEIPNTSPMVWTLGLLSTFTWIFLYVGV